MPELSRRNLITGLVAFVAAPAIVRASSLMPVRVLIKDETADLLLYRAHCLEVLQKAMQDSTWKILYGNLDLHGSPPSGLLNFDLSPRKAP